MAQLLTPVNYIIIIDKTALFQPQPSLEDSARFVCSRVYRESDHQAFTSMNFSTITS
jgi:hypothetical protein